MPRHQQRGKAKPAVSSASQRQLRVSELVRHALAEIFTAGDLHEPELAGRIITVPEVKMSPDLKLATAYIMPLGGEGADVVVAALDRHKKFLRGEVAHRINMKFAPDLRFRVDDRFDEAARIERLLKAPDVARDLDPQSDQKSDEE